MVSLSFCTQVTVGYLPVYVGHIDYVDDGDDDDALIIGIAVAAAAVALIVVVGVIIYCCSQSKNKDVDLKSPANAAASQTVVRNSAFDDVEFPAVKSLDNCWHAACYLPESTGGNA